MQPEQLSAQMQHAVTALRSGNPAEARDMLAAVVREGIDDASVWGVLAIACRDLGQMRDAQQAADRSIVLEPRNPRAFIVKADAYFASGDRRAAAAYYRDALKQSPPVAQCPADMQPEVERALARVSSLQDEFSRHLSAHIGDHIETVGKDSTRMNQAVDLLLGRRQTYYPEPHHLLFPGLPVREFYDPAEFSWVPEVEAATADIQRELAALLQEDADFGAYVTGDDDRPEYDTHGMKGNDSWGAFYLWCNGEAVPENQARCPVTTALMEKVPLVFSGRRCPNVLFSRLKAGATIPPHTGMVNTRLICHLPLIVQGNCGFRVGNDVREWQKGKVWMFDDTIEHEAWNRSRDDRIILLFEIWKPELTEAEQGLVTRLLEAVDSY